MQNIPVTISGNDFFVTKTIELEATKPGVAQYVVSLLKIAGEDIDTNLSPLEFSRLAAEMARSKMSSERLPGRLYWQDDLSYWMPDSNKAHPTGSGQEPSL